MPLYEVVLRSTYKNQQLINRWNYMGSGTPISISMSFALVQAMGFAPVAGAFPVDTIANRIQNNVHTATAFEEVQVKDVYGTTDFFTLPFVPKPAGQVTGEGASPLLAIGFKTNRVRSDIGRGTKRFGGVSEFTMAEGGEILAASIAGLTSLADAMSETLEYIDGGNTLTFIPCVVSKQKYVAPSGRDAYRYYPTFAEQDDHIASGVVWSLYTQIRSQVSRQYGRGI